MSLKHFLLAAVAIPAMAHGQKKTDTVTARFSTGSMHSVGGYASFDFADLDTRIASAGLPRAAHEAVTLGIGSDVRAGRMMLGASFQTLITRDRGDVAWRTRLAGSYSLVDLGVAAVQGKGWSIYPVAGLGLSHISVNVREKGEFTFDEGLARPARELGMSGLGALTHAGVLVEKQLRRGETEFAVSMRAGVMRGFGSQAWTSDAARVQGGPTGLRGSYVRVSFSRPLRHRRDALVPALGSVAQALR